VTGVDDCEPDGKQAYQIFSGKTVSTDSNYMAISAAPVNVVNADDKDLLGTTDIPDIHICNLSIVTENRIDAHTWEYTLKARMTDSASAHGVIAAKLVAIPKKIQLVDDTLEFGASYQGDTVTSNDSITLRSPSRISAAKLKKPIGFKWNVTVNP
jgi:hypothetical protein